VILPIPFLCKPYSKRHSCIGQLPVLPVQQGVQGFISLSSWQVLCIVDAHGSTFSYMHITTREIAVGYESKTFLLVIGLDTLRPPHPLQHPTQGPHPSLEMDSQLDPLADCLHSASAASAPI
jgi:hypothetical protein